MIKIITDSASDIPVRTLEKYDIEVLPIGLIKDEEEYTIGENIDLNSLVKMMKEGQVFRTSQVTRALVYSRLESYIDLGYDVIYICLSSGISGTYENALAARNELREKYKDARVEIVDSKAATMGQGMITVKAAMLRERGYDFDAIINNLEDIIKNQVHLFTVNDLEYLYRGGRLSKSSKIIAGLLNIFPILYVERENGKIISIDKARGKKAFFNKVKSQAAILSKDGIFDSNQTIVMCHADWEEMALEAKDFFIKELGVDEKNVVIENLGCVITSHTGPEALTIFFSSEPNMLNILDL